MKENAKIGMGSSTPVKPLTASLALGEVPAIKEPRLIDQWVLWLEQRPNEGGRTSVFLRPWGNKEVAPQELTPSPINLRSRVHGYGGGVLSSYLDGDLLLLAWIDDCDGCLWTQAWKPLSYSKKHQQNWLRPLHSPICLSRPGDFALADGLIDGRRNRWIGVMEKDGRDFFVSFSLNQENQIPSVIFRPQDFCGYGVLSPDGDQFAWVEWQQPSMPWEESQLWYGRFNDLGEIQDQKLLLGRSSDSIKSTSVFQPIWLSTGELLVAEDSSGWWNLMKIAPEFDSLSANACRPICTMQVEMGMPQWVYGMSTISISDEKIISLSCKEGRWRIVWLNHDGLVTELDQPFDDLAGLCADQGRVVAIASNPLKEPGLLEFDLVAGTFLHTPVRGPVLEENQISVPEPFWFKGFGGKSTHAWYYPPINWDGKPAPLLVKSHSGPTGMAGIGLNLAIQFWTSRGWGVVDVNYGGSTGFGREYRERLKGGWGVVDVFDCSAAAKSLVSLGKANQDYLAIEGGSAGGFTTLASLCFTDLFRVGACRYAVSDLVNISRDTHRFEAGYFENLLGPWPQDRQKYIDRSPLMHAEEINCPVIFFQGMKDQVVPPEQTERMAQALRNKNIPVEVHTFSEEGHGFRDSRVRIMVLEATEKFFRTHLGL